jgi:hypothetical protein
VSPSVPGSGTTLGLLVGLALGFAGVFGGFGALLVVALCAAVGLGVGRYLDGRLDIGALLGRGRDSRWGPR